MKKKINLKRIVSCNPVTLSWLLGFFSLMQSDLGPFITETFYYPSCGVLNVSFSQSWSCNSRTLWEYNYNSGDCSENVDYTVGKQLDTCSSNTRSTCLAPVSPPPVANFGAATLRIELFWDRQCTELTNVVHMRPGVVPTTFALCPKQQMRCDFRGISTNRLWTKGLLLHRSVCW